MPARASAPAADSAAAILAHDQDVDKPSTGLWFKGVHTLALLFLHPACILGYDAEGARPAQSGSRGEGFRCVL